LDHELTSISPKRSEEILQLIFDTHPEQQPVMVKPVQRIHFLKTAWIGYAAAILIILGTGMYLLTNKEHGKHATTAITNTPAQADIPPGDEKAVLTLADGKKIVLDHAANGNLARQGNTEVLKLSDGQIVYNLNGEPDQNLIWNTVTTPAGGQYQVTLPDGTKVWLNAESSITYPTAFISSTRPVKISGEVYFEVTRDKSKPFIVDVDGKSKVEVLGTSFNINSYGNEEAIKTTLIEGVVEVSEEKQSVILKPGQQAQISAINSKKDIVVLSNADLEQALAWKDGLFNFSDADLRAVMRQLERWYDIDVSYEGAVTTTKFSGKIYRNVHLSEVLRAMQRMGVNFRWQGKILVVHQKMP
jgi:ferric-dicitrate binding protein FerR (iron transport regulator)